MGKLDLTPSGTAQSRPPAGQSISKKRLGQYQTGTRLARLLAALAGAERAHDLIDPMAGTGDMLVACLEQGAHPSNVGGVEIDPIHHAACVNRIAPMCNGNSVIALGSAFDRSTLGQLPVRSWHLVITNPPYVRYQSLSKSESHGLIVPNSKQVRSALLEVIATYSDLDLQDKESFKRMAADYSGLSDLAVPSWILCASLVRIYGTLAVVVPETWLSRDYAWVVQYMLSRWFRILYVVEDDQAAWFPGAQVKTSLLVAQRIPRRDSAFSWRDDEGYMQLRLKASAIDTHSIVGRLHPGQTCPESVFASEAQHWLQKQQSFEGERLSAQWVPLSKIGKTLLSNRARQSWLQSLDELETVRDASCQKRLSLDPLLSNWLNQDTRPIRFMTIDELGVHVGQGLRTGANKFFYAECKDDNGTAEILAPSPEFGLPTIRVPKDCILPVLRRQSELPEGFVVRAAHLRGRVLLLQRHALPEDLIATNARKTYSVMPNDLADFVRIASKANIGSDESPSFIPQLSAVAPNVRLVDPKESLSIPRFWYMLPTFTSRHRPDLLVARINHRHPRALINEGRSAVVDANFSSLWLGQHSTADVFGLLAFLNSIWCTAVLELAGTVMGGGALKVEASHLRLLPIPDFDALTWIRLSSLGHELTCAASPRTEEVIDQVDKLVVEAIVGCSCAQRKLTEIRAISQERLASRSVRIQRVNASRSS